MQLNHSYNVNVKVKRVSTSQARCEFVCVMPVHVTQQEKQHSKSKPHSPHAQHLCCHLHVLLRVQQHLRAFMAHLQVLER